MRAIGAGRAATAADAYDDTGAWYLSPMGQYTLLDHRRVSKDNFGFQVGLGYDFAPQLAAEIALSSGRFASRDRARAKNSPPRPWIILFKVLPAHLDVSAVRAGRDGRHDR